MAKQVGNFTRALSSIVTPASAEKVAVEVHSVTPITVSTTFWHFVVTMSVHNTGSTDAIVLAQSFMR